MSIAGPMFAVAFGALLASGVVAAQARSLCGEAVADPAAWMAQLAEPQPGRIQETPLYIATQDRPKAIVWTITRPGHPAHPAIVCRRTFEENGAIQLEMNATCAGPKPACDQMMQEFEALNEQMRRHIEAAKKR